MTNRKAHRPSGRKAPRFARERPGIKPHERHMPCPPSSLGARAIKRSEHGPPARPLRRPRLAGRLKPHSRVLGAKAHRAQCEARPRCCQQRATPPSTTPHARQSPSKRCNTAKINGLASGNHSITPTSKCSTLLHCTPLLYSVAPAFAFLAAFFFRLVPFAGLRISPHERQRSSHLPGQSRPGK